MKFEYKKLLSSDIKGIHLGFSFINQFFDNLEEIEKKTSNSKVLTKLKLYDYRNDKNVELEVNSDQFREEMNEMYRNFLEKEYFSQFFWYNKLDHFLEIFLNQQENEEFNFSKSSLKNLILTSFVFFSNGSNRYEYLEIKSFIVSEISANFFTLEKNSIFIDKMFRWFEINNLISKKDEEIFFLSEMPFDIVLFFSSLWLPSFFPLGEAKGKNILIDDIIKVIDNFDFKAEKFLGFEREKREIKEKSFDLFEKLQSKVCFDITVSEIEDNTPLYNFYILYYYKIALNEYCFFSLILTPFEIFYNQPNYKNIFNSKQPFLFEEIFVSSIERLKE